MICNFELRDREIWIVRQSQFIKKKPAIPDTLAHSADSRLSQSYVSIE